MFCSYCGNEVAEGSAFCPHCGTALTAPTQPVEQTVTAGETVVLSENMIPPAAEQQEWPAQQQEWPAQQQEWPAEQQEWPAQQQEWSAQQQEWPAQQQEWPAEQQEGAYYSQVEPQATPKRRFPLKGVIAAAVAVVAVAALLLNMGTLVGSVIKTFGSDTAYYQYVELKTVKNGTDTVTDYYALFKDAFSISEQKEQGSIRPVLGEDAKELLQGLPADVKLDWLNDLKISYTGNYKDDVLMLELAVAVADGDPLRAIAILNNAEGTLLAGLPSASDTYLKLGLDSYADTGAENTALGTLLDDPDWMDDLQDVLPDEKKLDGLMDRYLAIALDMVKVSAEEKATLTVGDIEQKCTQSTIEVTQKMCSDILIAVLTEAKQDKEIKTILADVEKFFEEKELVEDIDLYAEYSKAIEETLTALKEAESNAADETVATMTTYISKQHEVIGRRIEAMGSEVFYYATAEKGSAFATEMTIANMVELSGNGTRKGNVVSGEYDIAVQGTVILELSVKDFDEGKAEDGYLNGSFRLTPKKALFEMAGADEEVALLISTYDPSLELVAKTTKDTGDVTLNLYKDESVLFGLVFESKAGKADKVKIPEQTVDATDEEALMNWLNDIEGETVTEKLENIGVPEQIMDLLNGVMGENAVSAPAYEY